jgi:hypothetical protein
MSILAVAAVLLAAEPEGVESKAPPYLPRYAVFQTFINQGAVVAAPRIGWEVNLIEQPRNTFVFLAEIGVSAAAVTPPGVGFFWEHFALGGLGYRMQRPSGFHWGFGVGFGAALYGNRGPNNNNEQRVGTYIEGKVHLGAKIGPITLSLCGGWGQPLTYIEQSSSQPYVGGPFIGVLLGWK